MLRIIKLIHTWQKQNKTKQNRTLLQLLWCAPGELVFYLLWDLKKKKLESGERDLRAEGKKKVSKSTERTSLSCLMHSGRLVQDVEIRLEAFRMVCRPRTLESAKLRLKLWLSPKTAARAAVFLGFRICRDCNTASLMRHRERWAMPPGTCSHCSAGVITVVVIAGATTVTTASLLEPLGYTFWEDKFHTQHSGYNCKL